MGTKEKAVMSALGPEGDIAPNRLLGRVGDIFHSPLGRRRLLCRSERALLARVAVGRDHSFRHVGT